MEARRDVARDLVPPAGRTTGRKMMQERRAQPSDVLVVTAIAVAPVVGCAVMMIFIGFTAFGYWALGVASGAVICLMSAFVGAFFHGRSMPGHRQAEQKKNRS